MIFHPKDVLVTVYRAATWYFKVCFHSLLYCSRQLSGAPIVGRERVNPLGAVSRETKSHKLLSDDHSIALPHNSTSRLWQFHAFAQRSNSRSQHHC